MRRILCWLGYHRWKRTEWRERTCARCSRKQYLVNVLFDSGYEFWRDIK